MPELPEVETVKIGLQKRIINKTIIGLDFDWPKGFPNSQTDVDAFVIGAKIITVRRRAKALLVDLDSYYSLLVHLKMTGQLVFVGSGDRFGAGHPNESLISELPDKSTRVTIEFKDASRLFFNDQRKFGWIKLFPTSEVMKTNFMQKLGPEPLDDSFDGDAFVARVQRRARSSIKAVLLDQTVLAGVGNIYADEALFAAYVHPAVRVGELSEEQLGCILKELKAVMNLSIQKGGSSDRNYVNADGKKGSYISFAKVFRKEGQPCQRDGTLIEKYRIAGRGTHVCPTCQARPQYFKPNSAKMR